MPTYDYKCDKCGKKFSERTTIAQHDKHKAKCPKCGSTKVNQLLEPFYAATGRKS